MTEVVSQARLQKRIEPSCAVKNQIFPMETRMNAWNQCWSNFIRQKWFWSLIIRICSNCFFYVPWALLLQWAWQWQCPSNRQSWRRTPQTVIRLMLPEPGSLGNKDDPTDPTTTGTTCLNQECARPSDTPVAENCIAYLTGRNAKWSQLSHALICLQYLVGDPTLPTELLWTSIAGCLTIPCNIKTVDLSILRYW